ncbi:MAG TPA: UDP-N-acetylmuramoyl-tripeptide--D-alanyl-D-alanine ligase [Solirubrobacteraceae bacterium]|jgi:UDP-N-acetylmuramoyl-tripeptide--D-alanyl-D-alanine ligase|nr:UDP-N-acetylmuramoyl-tripeptide--D-alanyl-D-alanine ligase [Solirubrobacteraceae bacterium]
MRRWDSHQVARAAGAQLLRGPVPGAGGPERVTIDSRDAGAGSLFVGLPGERVDGGSFAAVALAQGAWGVLVAPEHAEAVLAAGGPAGPPPGAVVAASEPLVALQRLANAWRHQLGAKVIGVTGSTGKTSTKDLLFGVLSPYRLTVASRANFNTEIGLPLQILAAPAGTEVLVLEMGMRGPGQIAELASIAQPDVGVIVSIGPVHLELLGSIEAIAAAKAELIAALEPGATAVVPVGETLLDPHRRDDVETVTFGPGGAVQLTSESGSHVEIDAEGDRISFDVDFTEAHLRHDLLAAVAAARAVGVQPGGLLELTLSPGRGQRRLLPGGLTLIDDAYNANPVSMRAALDALAATETSGRRIAVLGDMLELGPGAERFHEEIGTHADGIADILVSVGPLAAAMARSFRGEYLHSDDAAAAAALLPTLLRAGDVVLVKASNGVGLKLVCETLTAATPA